MKINPHASPEIRDIQGELIQLDQKLNDKAFKNDLSSVENKVSALEQKFESILKSFETGILPQK